MTPHFSYCDIVWGGTPAIHSESLQKTGNFAAQALLGLKKRSSAKKALKKLNMLPLASKRTIHLGVFVHKIVHNGGPEELVSRYTGPLTRDHKHNMENNLKE